VHEQGLARAGRAPERELVELLGLVRLDPVDRRGIEVEPCDLPVERRQEALTVAEVAVEIDLGEEQRQVLEVLGQHALAVVAAPLRDGAPMSHDVLVIGEQLVTRQMLTVEQPHRQRMVEA